MISDKISDRINCDVNVLCSLNFNALQEGSWQHGQHFMILKNAVTAFEEGRQLCVSKVRTNLKFLEMLFVSIEPSCPCVQKHTSDL